MKPEPSAPPNPSGDLLALQLTLYNSRQPTRRYLHTTRRDWIQAAIARVAPPGPGTRALEIGPGSGVYLPTLCGAFDEVVASDIEPAFLAQAERLRATHPNLSAVADNVCDTGLPRGSFDLVLCSEVIEHIPAAAPALAGIFGLLRPGGVLILSTPQRYSPIEVIGKVALMPGVIHLTRAIYSEPVLPTGHINLLRRRTLQRLLDQAGFAVEEEHLSGLYLPFIAEAGGHLALRLERALEPIVRRSPFRGFLWTQFYVARKPLPPA